MNEPIEPTKVRQARQGKPVLLILAVSMVLAIIAGWILWGVIAEDTDSSMTDNAAITLEQPTPDS
jgi:hypothetical protein